MPTASLARPVPHSFGIPADLFVASPRADGFRAITGTAATHSGHSEPSAMLEEDPSVSPDGRQVIFSRSGRLWVMPTRGGTPRALIGLTRRDGLAQPVSWSPDGRAILGVDREGLLVGLTARGEETWAVDIPEPRRPVTQVAALGRTAALVVAADGVWRVSRSEASVLVAPLVDTEGSTVRLRPDLGRIFIAESVGFADQPELTVRELDLNGTERGRWAVPGGNPYGSLEIGPEGEIATSTRYATAILLPGGAVRRIRRGQIEGWTAAGWLLIRRRDFSYDRPSGIVACASDGFCADWGGTRFGSLDPSADGRWVLAVTTRALVVMTADGRLASRVGSTSPFWTASGSFARNGRVVFTTLRSHGDGG